MDSADSPIVERVRHRVRRWPRRLVVTIAVLAAILVAVRLALPGFIRDKVNERLESVPGYTGYVEDIDLSLIRGAYALDGVSIYRQTGDVREPFVLARRVDFSIAWRELFRGKIVSDIFVETGHLNFVVAETEQASQTDTDRRWQDVIQDLFPIDITHFELTDGVVRYQDKTREPEIDVFAKDLHVYATGLRNRPDEREGEEFPAHINIEGETLGGGHLLVTIEAEPLAEQPHFDLTMKLDGVSLPALNDSLKAMANVDVGRGKFQLAGEMAGKNGGFQGYIKPFFEDLDFTNIEDQEKGIGTRLWEKVVAGLAWLVKNKPRDEVATRIPFSGRFGDPQVGLWATVTNLFRHGFVRAFNPTIEGTVEPDNIRPDGKSADGRDVAEVKDEGRGASDENRPGAPTGRPTGGR